MVPNQFMQRAELRRTQLQPLCAGSLGNMSYSLNPLNNGESNGKENGNWDYVRDYRGHSLNS